MGVPDRIAAAAGRVRDAPELLALLLGAAALRTYRLGAESLWLDEAYSVVVTSNTGIVELALEHPLSDPHPPLHYLLLKAWMPIFGRSEAAVRAPSVLFGVGSVALTYALGRRVYGRRAGTLAAALVAVSPLQVWYAQEARAYAMLTFFALGSYYLLVRLAEAYDHRRALAYVAVTAALGYTHVFALFVVLAQNLYVFGRLLAPGDRLRLGLREWVPLQALVAGLLSPWLYVLAERAVALSGGAGSPISWIPEPTPSLFPETLRLFAAGAHLDAGLSAVAPNALAAVALLLSALAVVRYDGGSTVTDLEPAALFALLAVVPVAVPYVLSQVVTPVLVLRYTIPASVGLYLLVGRGAAGLPSLASVVEGPPVPAARPLAGSLLVVVLCLGLLAPLPAYYGADQKTQWDDAATLVEEGAGEEDLVVVAPTWLDRPFGYYYGGQARLLRVSPSVSGDELRGQATGYEDVYLVLGYMSSDQRQRIKDAIAAEAYLTDPRVERWFDGVMVVKYRYNEEGV